MAISSANFQKAKSNSVAETTREFEAKYLLPKEHRGKNEFYNCGVDEKILFNQEVAKAERKGGRVPKLENSLWEGVINLNKKHTIEDVNRVGEHIAKKFNLHYTRGALHRDEGHINEKGKVEYNYHAHINFMTYKDGKQNWRLEFVNKEALRELQTEVAELLGMDRGEFNSKSVRANHRHFRVNAEEIKAERIAVKEVLNTKEQLKDVKKENSSLKGQNTKNKNEKEKLKEANKALEMQLKELNTQLQKQLSNREQHAKREALVKELKEELKNKTLTTETMQTKFAELEERLLKENEHLKSIIEVKEIDLVELKNQNKSLQEQKTVLADKVTDLEEKINSSSNMSDYEDIKYELQETKENIEIFEEEYRLPKTGNLVKILTWIDEKFKEFRKLLKSKDQEIQALKEEIEELKNSSDFNDFNFEDLSKISKENAQKMGVGTGIESESSLSQKTENFDPSRRSKRVGRD